MSSRLLERGKTSGRADDNEETIKKRLVTFHSHMQPILDHYGNKVVTIPADRGTEEIFVDVCKSVDERCKC